VPIEAIIFGGRRSTTVPLGYEAFNWQHGTFIGSTVNSETTAAATGKRGVLRPDPFAMKPFIGYNMGDYFAHWLKMGKTAPEKEKLPKIFHVNWFRKNAQGKFLWPGFGENARVLKWIFERTDNAPNAVDTAIGRIPSKGALDVEGLKLMPNALEDLFQIDAADWKREILNYTEFHNSLGDRLPQAIKQERDALSQRIEKL